MEVVGYSETLVLVYQTIWHHIPENRNIKARRRLRVKMAWATPEGQWNLENRSSSQVLY
jgi:hypothetical protein